jgi:hypothetical protein
MPPDRLAQGHNQVWGNRAAAPKQGDIVRPCDPQGRAQGTSFHRAAAAEHSTPSRKNGRRTQQAFTPLIRDRKTLIHSAPPEGDQRSHPCHRSPHFHWRTEPSQCGPGRAHTIPVDVDDFHRPQAKTTGHCTKCSHNSMPLVLY